MSELTLKKLFSRLTISSLTLENRIVMVPMVMHYTTAEGFVNDRVKEYYWRRAQGGVGLVIVEAAGVTPGKSGPLLRIHDDCFIPGWRSLVEGIHAHGVKCALQLVHFLKLSPRSGYRQTPVDLTVEDIRRVIEDLVRGAQRARQSGFDAVEFHMAHAYTLASFLSPASNGRRDGYGRTIEGRMRIAVELLERTREAVGPDYPIGCRINADEFVLGGSTLKHSRLIARRLEQLGIDFLDLSAGGKFEDGLYYTGYSGTRSMPPAYMPDAVNVYLAGDIKQHVKIPVVTAGKIPVPALAETILQEGKADLVGLARPLLCDPDWPLKAKEGRWKEIVRCNYCNSCLEDDRNFRPVVCTRRQTPRAN